MAEMNDMEMTRHLAEKVMGWEIRSARPTVVDEHPYTELNRFGDIIRWQVWGAHGRAFKPLTSRDDCAEVEVALPEEKRALYVSKLRHEVGLSYPISAFGQIDLFKILTATTLQRGVALVEATR